MFFPQAPTIGKHILWSDFLFKHSWSKSTVISTFAPFKDSCRCPISHLLRCCVIHVSIIILRYFLHLLYLCLWLDLVIFMSYLCDVFFIFISIFIMINHIISWKQTHLFFAYFLLEYVLLFLDNSVVEEWCIIFKWQKFKTSKGKTSGCFLAFACFFANFSLALLMKVLLIEKRVYIDITML